MAEYLPINLKTSSLNALIIGGGNVASRKAGLIASRVKSLSLVAPEIRKIEGIKLHERAYQKKDLSDIQLLYVAVNKPSLRDQIFLDLKDHPFILSNFADFPQYCNFISPALWEEDEFVVAVSSFAQAPKASAVFRDRIKETMGITKWKSYFQNLKKEHNLARLNRHKS
jgi:precorrin-2 dehydrogenase/sirohydrochlorin ferrochelatase